MTTVLLQHKHKLLNHLCYYYLLMFFLCFVIDKVNVRGKNICNIFHLQAVSMQLDNLTCAMTSQVTKGNHRIRFGGSQHKFDLELFPYIILFISQITPKPHLHSFTKGKKNGESIQTVY